VSGYQCQLARLIEQREARKHQWQQIYGSIVIVAGSRTFHHDYPLFCSVMDEWKKDHGHTLDTLWTFLSGDARRGADFLIKRYCGLIDQDGNPLVQNDMDDRCELLPALWNEYGKRAGMLRNHEMGDIATHLVVFWDKKSSGTKDMLDYGRQKKLHVTEVWVSPDE
jgi:hypothetical protein